MLGEGEEAAAGLGTEADSCTGPGDDSGGWW